MGGPQMPGEVLPLDQYAALSALIDAGIKRDVALERAALSSDAWLKTQTFWLFKLAADNRLGRRALQTEFNEQLLAFLAAIDAGDDVLMEVGLGAGSASPPALAATPAVVSPPPALAATPAVVSSPAPAPTPTPPPAAEPAEPAPVVRAAPERAAALPPKRVSPASLVRKSAEKAGYNPDAPAVGDTAPPRSRPHSSRRGIHSTLMPFRAVSEASVVRAARTVSDSVVPFITGAMPAGLADGVLPFSASSSTAAVPPRRPQPRGPQRPFVLPFQQAGAPPVAMPPSPPIVQADQLDTLSVDTMDEAATLADTADAPESHRSKLLSQTSDPLNSTMNETLARPHKALPFASVKPAVGRPRPKKLDTLIDPDMLGETMSRARKSPLATMPFKKPPAPVVEDKPARPPASFGPGSALPFGNAPAKPPPPLADASSDNIDLGGTVVAAGRDKAEPNLTFEQFASITAEIEVSPEEATTIEQRYGLTTATHAQEKLAWAMRFLADPVLGRNFTGKVREFRKWLQTSQKR